MKKLYPYLAMLHLEFEEIMGDEGIGKDISSPIAE